MKPLPRVSVYIHITKQNNMKPKNLYDIHLVMHVLAMLLTANNVVVKEEHDTIVITGQIEGRKVEMHISLYNPQLRYVLAKRDKPEVTVTCYVDDAKAFGGVTIEPEDYEKINVEVDKLSKLKAKNFDAGNAWEFLKLDKVEG